MPLDNRAVVLSSFPYFNEVRLYSPDFDRRDSSFLILVTEHVGGSKDGPNDVEVGAGIVIDLIAEGSLGIKDQN